MNYLQLMYLLGFCSCFCLAEDEHVQLEATRTLYNVGNTVTLTCYVRSGWLTVAFGRNNSDLGYCNTIMNRCYPTTDIRDRYGNYELKLEKSRPMLVIKNVTRDDDGTDFTCHWTSYTATTSFSVTDEHVKFITTKLVYNIGATVTLTCYVRLDWLLVSFERNNSDIRYCYSKINECYPTADIRERYGNYELKLEKSRSMLVIKNVTIDDDGADFTCQWTSYTDTISFAVTDIAETTPSMSEENVSDCSMVLVLLKLVVAVASVILLVIIGIVIVRQPEFYCRKVKGCTDMLERRSHKNVKAPINTDTERNRMTGQELQTKADQLSVDISEDKASLNPNGDDNCDHQQQ